MYVCRKLFLKFFLWLQTLWFHSPWKTLPLFLVISFVGCFFGEFALCSGCLFILVFPAYSFVLADLGLLPDGLYTPTCHCREANTVIFSTSRAWFTLCDLCFPHDRISLFLYTMKPDFWKTPGIRSMAGFCTCWCGTQPVSCASLCGLAQCTFALPQS